MGLTSLEYPDHPAILIRLYPAALQRRQIQTIGRQEDVLQCGRQFALRQAVDGGLI
jgi:hypothetical protein